MSGRLATRLLRCAPWGRCAPSQTAGAAVGLHTRAPCPGEGATTAHLSGALARPVPRVLLIQPLSSHPTRAGAPWLGAAGAHRPWVASWSRRHVRAPLTHAHPRAPVIHVTGHLTSSPPHVRYAPPLQMATEPSPSSRGDEQPPPGPSPPPLQSTPAPRGAAGLAGLAPPVRSAAEPPTAEAAWNGVCKRAIPATVLASPGCVLTLSAPVQVCASAPRSWPGWWTWCGACLWRRRSPSSRWLAPSVGRR